MYPTVKGFLSYNVGSLSGAGLLLGVFMIGGFMAVPHVTELYD